MANLMRIASAIFIIISCGGNNNTEDNEDTKVQQIEEQPASVSTSIIGEDPFYSELIANGKMTAVQRADLHFQMSRMIISVIPSHVISELYALSHSKGDKSIKKLNL